MGLVLSGIATLDLTEASPEILRQIVSVSGTATVLLSETSAKYLTGFSMSGCASVVVLSPGAVLVEQRADIDRSYLEGVQEPVVFHLMDDSAVLVFADDIDPAILGRKVRSIGGEEGLVVCPPSLRAIVCAKKRSTDNVVEAADYLGVGIGRLDSALLRTLPDGSRILHLGVLKATDLLESTLVDTKIRELEVRGPLTIREEMCRLLGGRLKADKATVVTIIAEGSQYIEGDLLIDSAYVDANTGSRLHVERRLSIAPGITAEQLARSVSSVRAKHVFCRVGLREAARRLCSTETRIISYRGDLVLMADMQYVLSPEELSYRAGTMAFWGGNGQLVIDPTISSEALADRIEYIDFEGQLVCSTHQLGVLKTKLAGSRVHVRNRDEVAPPRLTDEEASPKPEAHRVISGLAYLKL